MKNRTKLACTAALLAVGLPAGAAFRCVDKGITYVGDTPPDQCANVVMYETSAGGTVIRRIEPSLTADQVKAKAEEAERRKEADKAAQEQKRKDLALLASFSTDAEFDTARDRNIEPLTGRIKSANDRMAAIDKRTAELNDEMEFYKAGKRKSKDKDGKEKAGPEVPPMLKEELARLKHERETLNRNVQGYEKEIVALRTKFDTDKKRWIALKRGETPLAPSAEPPTAASVPPAARK